MNTLAEQDSLPKFEKTIFAVDVGRSAVRAFALSNQMKIPLVFPSIVTRAVKLAEEETTALCRTLKDTVSFFEVRKSLIFICQEPLFF